MLEIYWNVSFIWFDWHGFAGDWGSSVFPTENEEPWDCQCCQCGGWQLATDATVSKKERDIEESRLTIRDYKGLDKGYRLYRKQISRCQMMPNHHFRSWDIMSMRRVCSRTADQVAWHERLVASLPEACCTRAFECMSTFWLRRTEHLVGWATVGEHEGDVA